MKITVFIFGILAILLNDLVSGEPIKQNINKNNKNSGSAAAAAVPEIIIGGKNPKRDSSDQTVEDKTGQSQNYQPQVQYQSYIPAGQYFQQPATQQVNYAKPEGGIEYAKSEGGIQYASSTHRPAAYQTISYSAHQNGGQQQQQHQQPQPHNGKILAQITPVHYYTLPQHNHQQIQYAFAITAGNGHPHHQQIAFAALPGYHNQQNAPQILYAAHPSQIGQYYRGESAGQYSAVPAIPQQQQQQHHHQLPQFALISAPHHHQQIGYTKLPPANTQQAFIYTTHPGQHYFPGQSGTHGYYQQHPQSVYQNVQPSYALAVQPAIQISPKQIQSTLAPISVTPAPVVHYKNFITTVATNPNHHGATSFSTYSAQLPAHSHNTGGALQVIKAPVSYATTPTPVATYQHNGGSLAGKIYYAAIPPQYQDGGQGYAHHGAIHYAQHLYHPASPKAILTPTPSPTGQKY